MGDGRNPKPAQTGAKVTIERHEPDIGSSWGGAVLRAARTDTTLDNGYLGSRIDEERSEMRYVVRIAESREPSSL